MAHEKTCKAKCWSLWTLRLLVLLLLLSLVLTWFFDPFFQYHKPFDMVTYTLHNQDYQNKGIVSQFDYDTLLTGTSMVENFETTWFRAQGISSMVKVPYAGGYMVDLHVLVGLALEKNARLKTIYWGMDGYALFDKTAAETHHSFPWYLYDDKLLNDVSYVFNKDVLFQEVLPSLKNTLEEVPSTSFDQYSNHGDLHKYGMHEVLRFYDIMKSFPMEGSPESKDFNQCLQNAMDNLHENILPLVQAYPQVDFVFFDTPYSVLYWYQVMEEGRLGDTMEAWVYAVEQLISYPNVSYHLFADEALITNLYNYRDYIHSSSNVSEWMVQNLFTDAYRLTKDNYRKKLSDLHTLLRDFDYSIFQKNLFPLFTASDVKEYVSLLQEERYTILVAGQAESPEGMTAPLQSLGLSHSTETGYLAAVSAGQVIAWQAGEGYLSLQLDIQGKSFLLESDPEKGRASISMEDIFPQPVVYTQEVQGLHLVVYDAILERVVDNRRF